MIVQVKVVDPVLDNMSDNQNRTGIYDNELVFPNPNVDKCLFKRISDLVPARFVLYLLSWSGFLVSFMMRTDINLAIVAMVEDPVQPDAPNSTEVNYCYDVDYSQNGSDAMNYGGTLPWSSNIQSYVLASFYWAYIVAQVVGGLATQRFGTKIVFGYAQLATALCSLCIPVASVTHYGIVILLRSIQGFASGLTWPAMYAVVGHWIPTQERSRFMSSFQGFSIGIGVTYPLCGYLIAHFGWQSVFYTTGTTGVVYCIVWYFLAFDSPEHHPRISSEEVEFIRNNTENSLAVTRNLTVPWTAILKSMAAWSIGISTFGRIWVHYTFIIPGPKYMKSILGFSIEKNGLLSGAPFILSYLSSVVFCYIADKLVTKNILSLLTVRKIFQATSQVIPGILVLVIGYSGCDLVTVLIVWFIAVTCITAAYAGAMASIVDIAPNFAGPVLAFAQTIHMTASFLSPLAAGYLTQDGHTLGAWRNVFGVTAFVAISTYFVFQFWGSADVQSWNDPLKPDLPETEYMLDKNGKSENSKIIGQKLSMASDPIRPNS